jgi:sialidase-1
MPTSKLVQMLIQINAATLATAAAEPTQTDIFVSGRDGYHTYRIPAIIIMTKGTLLAFCEGRKTSRSDHGDIDLLVKRSLNVGKTWTKQQIVHDDSDHTIGNPCPVVDQQTGTIWLPFCRNNDRVFVTKSTDDGASWSKPIEITRDVKPPDWTWYATGPGHGIQLRSGRLLIPCDHRERAKGGTMFSHVFYSDDHGATWKLGGSLGENTDECMAVECEDGSVYLNMRSYHKKNRRAVAWSRDGGQTWSDVKLDETLIEPVCQASIVRLSNTKGSDRGRILFANPASTKRENMTVRISHDECRTWNAGKVLYSGPSAYSDLCVLPDRTIGCLYERGAKHAYETITFARFTLDWLTGGADRPAEPACPHAGQTGVGTPRLGERDAASVTASTSPSKHLLLDSRIIDRAENVRLALGQVTKHPKNPLFAEDKPWEPRFDNLYANVLYDEEEQLYKCWYSPFIIEQRTTGVPRDKRAGLNYLKVTPNHREMGICYATSKDGLTWIKPELGLVEFDGNTKNNLVLRGPHGAGIFKDLQESDPARRYKMFTKQDEKGPMCVAFSSDGLRWSKLTPCPEIASAGDTHNNAFWAPELGKYVGITRLWSKENGRLVGRCESSDFLKWTKARDVMHRLPTEPYRQTYAMPVFRYANVYLGLLMLLDTKTDLVDCELTWSPDTIQWQRVCPGQPLIPRGPAGSCDSGCIYAAAYPVIGKDEIRLYYGGNNGPHTTWRDGFFCLATLRPDGFAGLESIKAEAPGTILTRPIYCTGKDLHVTADMAGGSLRVGIELADGLSLDDCRPISGNVTDEVVTWKNGRNMTDHAGKPIRLRFELRSGMLYSFSL